MNPIISIVINCYRAQAALNEQLAHWLTYAPELLQRVELVIVDDGSDPALQIDPARLPAMTRLVLARIDEDIPWNMPGARNLGALLARGEFLLLHDIDHFLSESALRILLTHSSALSRSTLYKFQRTQDGEIIDSHINSFLCSRDGFWLAGGYDEDFSGHYGHEDSDFLLAWQRQVGAMVRLNDVALDVRSQYSTSGLSRDTTRNSQLFREKAEAGPTKSRTRLRFPWALVPTA